MKGIKKRLFIAINLPQNIRDKIAAEIERIRYDFAQDIRFMEPVKWHITLVFLGYQKDELVNNILEAMEECAANFQPPVIELSSITYGPLDKTPRMIWTNGSLNTSKVLAELKNCLVDALSDRGVNFKQEYRGFKTHITLARFQTTRKEKLPLIDKKFDWHFTANSLDLMESRLKRSGAEYTRLAGVEFYKHE